jgi:hypothetical protein
MDMEQQDYDKMTPAELAGTLRLYGATHTHAETAAFGKPLLKLLNKFAKERAAAAGLHFRPFTVQSFM